MRPALHHRCERDPCTQAAVSLKLRATSGALAMVAGLLASPIVRAAGPDKDECAFAYEAGQRLRQRGQLRSARAELTKCAQPSCPAVLAPDCKRWADEVASSLPTIIVVSAS